jgi:hypothetical protein
MSLRDRLFGDPDTDDMPAEIDHYRVSHQCDGDGWEPVDGYEKLDEPITKQTFEYNEAPLDPGHYTLFGVQNNLNAALPDDIGWKIVVEGDHDEDTPADSNIDEERLRELEAQLAELDADATDDENGPSDLEQRLAEQQAAVALEMLQDPEFIEEHGDKIVRSMLTDSESASE